MSLAWAAVAAGRGGASAAKASNSVSSNSVLTARTGAMHINVGTGLEAALRLRGRLVQVLLIDSPSIAVIGVLSACSNESVTLRMIQRIPVESHAQTLSQDRVHTSFEEEWTMPFSRVLLLRATTGSSVSQASTKFATDREITTQSDDASLVALQPWSGDGHHDAGNTLDDEAARRPDARGWDQFAVNQKLFGYESSYVEDDYTTPVDKDSNFYRRYEQRAARLAAEINLTKSTNVHEAEERGQDVDNTLCEEDRFSTVLPLRSGGKDRYQIPARRKASPAPNAKSARIEDEDKCEVEAVPKDIGPEVKADTAAKSTITLNPEAPAFSFNPLATEFVMSEEPEVEQQQMFAYTVASPQIISAAPLVIHNPYLMHHQHMYGIMNPSAQYQAMAMTGAVPFPHPYTTNQQVNSTAMHNRQHVANAMMVADRGGATGAVSSPTSWRAPAYREGGTKPAK